MEDKKDPTVQTSKETDASQDIGSLVVAKAPDKTKYAAGERISLKGLSVMLDGKDVTDECVPSVGEGTAFPSDKKAIEVTLTHESGQTATITLKRKRKLLVPILLALLVAGAVGGGAWVLTHPAEPAFPEGETGSYLIPKGDMSDEEAQRMLDEMTEKSRTTVSLAPEMRLRDNGDMRVNLVVPEGNNGLSERLEVEQDGRVVYRSGVVPPGNRLEWGSNSQAHEGDATATVYAVQDEADFGNPVSVEVTIVKDNQ